MKLITALKGFRVKDSGKGSGVELEAEKHKPLISSLTDSSLFQCKI
jgi:hypothetical protein